MKDLKIKMHFYEFRKKHIALPLLVITLAIIILIQNYIRCLAANCTFYLEDLYGSREHLSNVIISGNLQDGYHNNIFKIENGNLEIRTVYYHHYKDFIPLNTDSWFSKFINNVEYVLTLYFDGKEVIANIKYYDRNPEKSRKSSYREATIKTDIINEKYTDGSWTTATSTSYVITNIGDRIFFTIPTTEGYSGTNGIYEVVNFSDNFNYFLYTKIKQEEESDLPQNNQHDTNNQVDKTYIDETYIRTVAEFSINVNHHTESSYLEVFGLEAVGNYLVLILRQGSSMVFRAYDSESGEQTGEVIINDSSSYLERYKAFVSNNTLNLSLIKRNSGDENIPGDKRRILTFEILHESHVNKNENTEVDNENKNAEIKTAESYYNDGVIMHGNLRLTNIIDAVYLNSEIDRIFNIYHKDNKVYIVLSLIESEADKITPYNVLRPRRMFIYVYEDSKPVYVGEIITDMNQDNIFQLYEPSTSGGIPYNTYERRLFEDIRIRSNN